MARVEGRVVARSQITLRGGELLGIFKWGNEVCFCFCNDRTAKNLGELLICPSYYMPGENTHSFRNVHFYAISEQLLGVRHSYTVSLSREWMPNETK